MDTNISKGVAGDTELANWIVDIDARVGNRNMVSQEELQWKTSYIYKVPLFKRERNPSAYTPLLVSFGPFHYDNSELKKMEVHKERALVHFLRRTNQSLQNIKQEVAKIMDDLRDAYDCLDDRWKTNDEEFLKIMILDGCFTLEILQTAELLFQNYDMDLYFNTGPKLWYIKRDMLLIENQLPLLLLKTLVHFQTPNPTDDYINRMVLKLVWPYNDNAPTNTRLLGLHALDIYHRSLLSPELEMRTPSKPLHKEPFFKRIHCATELHEAGVRFDRSGNEKLNNIRFEDTGKLCLPFLFVDSQTECILLNITIFEELHVKMRRVVSAYVSVMDEIIDSTNDVRLLREKGLIFSVGSDEEVAKIFNRISQDLPVGLGHDDDLFWLRAEVYKYCRRRRNRWRAYFIHTYFKNPWTIISLAGALLVIALTIAQTVYATRGK